MATPANPMTVFLDPISLLLTPPQADKSENGQRYRRIRSCATWTDHERGRLSESECIMKLLHEMRLLEPKATEAQLKETLVAARQYLSIDVESTGTLQEMKCASEEGALRLIAVINVPLPEWEMLRAQDAESNFPWDIFDRIILSCRIGKTKSDPGFFEEALEAIDTLAKSAILVEGSLDTVMQARSCGMAGIVALDISDAFRVLRNHIGDPVERGYRYLQSHAGNLFSKTDGGITVRDNFSQMLIAEATGCGELVRLPESPRPHKLWTYELKDARHPLKSSTDDLKTTVMALLVVKYDHEDCHAALSHICGLINAGEFIISSAECDSVAYVNALRLFGRHGRFHEVRRIWLLVLDNLYMRGHLELNNGAQPETELFLFFLTRLWAENQDNDDITCIREVLEERVAERARDCDDALSLSLYVLCCQMLGLEYTRELAKLQYLQAADGGWQGGYVSCSGWRHQWLHNRGVTTAFAVRAIMQKFDTDDKELIETPAQVAMKSVPQQAERLLHEPATWGNIKERVIETCRRLETGAVRKIVDWSVEVCAQVDFAILTSFRNLLLGAILLHSIGKAIRTWLLFQKKQVLVSLTTYIIAPFLWIVHLAANAQASVPKLQHSIVDSNVQTQVRIKKSVVGCVGELVDRLGDKIVAVGEKVKAASPRPERQANTAVEEDSENFSPTFRQGSSDDLLEVFMPEMEEVDT